MTNRLASDEGTDDPEIFRLRMQLTFAETRILELKKELVKEYNRAVDAEERAMHAEEAASSIGSEQLRAIRQQLRQTNEEMQTALSERIHATKLAEQAEQEAQQLRKEVQNMRLANEKLSTELQQRGPTMQPHPYSPVVNQLHTTITARDAKIEQLVDKYDKLTMEHFIVLKQVNKVGEEAEVLLAKNENLTVEIKEVRVRLAAVEKDRDWYVHLYYGHSTAAIRDLSFCKDFVQQLVG
jgi:chromosome segregation ATPase